MRFVPFLLLFAFFSAYSAECVRCDDYFYGRNGTVQSYQKAFELYSADTDNPDSMNNAGYIMHMGLGMNRDDEKALFYYTKAAEGGDPYGMYNLANLMKSFDMKSAFEWMKKAADSGFARAMSDLGCMYEKGEGVEQNYFEALKMFSLAADSGDKYGFYNLGIMFMTGRGVEQNSQSADKWFAMAASKGLRTDQTPTEVKQPAAIQTPLSKLISIDKSSGLTWQDNADASAKEMTWSEADKYCKKLNISGVTGWRMPNLQEVLSLVDTAKSPSVKNIFNNKSIDVYWTSNLNPSDKSSARVVYLFNGADYWSEKSFLYHVRCVRNR